MDLHSHTHPVWPLLVGIGLLAGMHGTQRWLEGRIAGEQAKVDLLHKTAEQIAQAQEHYASLKELKAVDVARFKAGFSGLAISRKTLFESGLSLQEERRLLEKQLEIMTTYLIVNPSLQRIFLMRGDQPLQSYLISHIPLRSFPSAEGLAASTTPSASVPIASSTVLRSAAAITTPIRLPALVRIVSKERFANPERGKSDMVNGHLQYTPPQVGTSVRSNALGEYVMFTNSALILHGPPVNPEDHEKFPHICAGLDLEAAKKLYRGSFIGTKIILTQLANPNGH